MVVKHFVNLTNGLEWAAELPSYSFVRVESTAIEKGDWDRILRDLDANLLMSLAMGHECHLYDCGTRRPTSKTISKGVPYIVDALRRFWLRDERFEARTAIRQQLKRKLTYYKRFLYTEEIRLVGHSRATERDGDVLFYRGLIGVSETRGICAEHSKRRTNNNPNTHGDATCTTNR